MPHYSAFTPFGMLAYSGRPSHAQDIYESLRENFGETYNTAFDGRQQSRLYAAAMCLASAQYQLDRAGNNRNPAKATELLGLLELDFQVVAPAEATLPERRRTLAAREKVTRGARREAVEAALTTLLGADFIEYRTTDPADIVTTPASPGTVGVFADDRARKKYFTLNEFTATHAISKTVSITLPPGQDPPVVGEIYCVDPDPRGNIEQITITGVGVNTVTTVFQSSHEAGTVAVRPHPYWISNQRLDTVVVTLAVANDPETRRSINELFGRMLRGVSTWQIVQASTPGFLTLDDPD